MEEIETVNKDIRELKDKRDSSGAKERGTIERTFSERQRVREALSNPETKASLMAYIFEGSDVNPLEKVRKG